MNNNNTENNLDERGLMSELYSFVASDGNLYMVKPAPLEDILREDRNFIEKINAVGVPILEENKNPRILCIAALTDPVRRKYIEEFIERYVFKDDKHVTLYELSDNGLTIDDIALLIKKLAGISG